MPNRAVLPDQESPINPRHGSGGKRRFRIAVFIAGMLLVWGTALLTPLYPDEFAYRLIGSRYFFDHGLLGNIFITCGSFEMPAPTSWIPAKYVDYALFGWYDSPAYYRVVSILTLGCIAAGAATTLQRAGYNRKGIALFFCLLCMGTLPFQLVLTRPEPMIFACLVALTAFALDTRPVWGKGIPVALISFLLSSILLSQHPESFMLLPALAVTQTMIVRRRGTPLAVSFLSSAAETWLVVDSARYWARFSSCPENAGIQTMLNGLTLSPQELTAQPGQFFATFGQNILDSGKYARGLWFRDHISNSWLPGSTHALAWVDPIINVIICLILLTMIAALAFLLFQASEVPERLLARTCSWRTHKQTFLSVLLALAVFLWAGINTGKQFYETAFLLPILLLAIFLHPRLMRLISNRITSRRASWALAAFSIFWGVLAPAHFLLPLLQGFQGHSVSIATLSPDHVRQEIDALSPACNMSPDPASMSHVLVDDLTYQFFRKSYKPVMITWMQLATLDMDRSAFLRKFGVAGIMTRCSYIPENVKNSPYFYMTKQVPDPLLDVCCVSPRAYDAR